MGLVAKGIFLRGLVHLGWVALTLSFFISTEPVLAQAQQYASHQRRDAATGYYSRARTLMVEALAEFEQGRKYAQPDLLIDSEQWRLSLISLTEELNRVIDPKPRVTRDGVRFRANPRLVSRERNRLPPVPDGALDSNVYGEQQRLSELQSARARMHSVPKQPVVAADKSQQTEAPPTETSVEAAKVRPADAELSPLSNDQLGLSTEPQVTDEEDEEEGTEAATAQVDEKELSEDQRIEAAINAAIRERLKSLEKDSGGKS